MRALFALFLAVLSSCASSGSPEPGRPIAQTVRLNGGSAGSLTINPSTSGSATPLPYTVQQVWRVLPQVFDSLGIPIGVLDPAAYQVGNSGYKLRRQLGGVPLSRYFNCGETQIGPNADSYEVYLRAMAQVNANPDGTATIATTMDAAARPMAFAQDYTRCSSTGQLEARILEATRRRLSQ